MNMNVLQEMNPRRIATMVGVTLAAAGALPAPASADGASVVNRGACIEGIARTQHETLHEGPAFYAVGKDGTAPFTIVNGEAKGTPPQPGRMGCDVK